MGGFVLALNAFMGCGLDGLGPVVGWSLGFYGGLGGSLIARCALSFFWRPVGFFFSFHCFGCGVDPSSLGLLRRGY